MWNFFNIKEANAKIDTLTVEAETLNATIAGLTKEKETLCVEIEELKKSAEVWENEKNALIEEHAKALKEQNDMLKAEYEKQMEEFTKASDEKLNKDAVAKAADIVSSLGVAPDTVPVANNDVLVAGKGYKVIDYLRR